MSNFCWSKLSYNSTFQTHTHIQIILVLLIHSITIFLGNNFVDAFNQKAASTLSSCPSISIFNPYISVILLFSSILLSVEILIKFNILFMIRLASIDIVFPPGWEQLALMVMNIVQCYFLYIENWNHNKIHLSNITLFYNNQMNVYFFI